MLPDFLLISSQRCGTTWFYNCTTRHPKIFCPKLKEPHFFDLNYSKGLGWYEEFFKDAPSDSLVGDFTAGYLSFPDSPALIKKHLSEVKLISILRNPVRRAYSHYWLERSLGKIRCSFEKAFKEFPNIFIEKGLYCKHLLRYLNLFEKERILILFFDDLKNNPESVLKKSFDFLEIDSSFVPENIYKKSNPPNVPRNIMMNDFMGWIRDICQKHQLVFILDLLKATGIPGFIKKKNRVLKKYPPLDPSVRDRLNRVFYSDICQLENLLDKDLSNWK